MISSNDLANAILDYINSPRRDALVLKNVPKEHAVDWAKKCAEWISTLTVDVKSSEPIEVGVTDEGTAIQFRKAGKVQ